MACWKIPHLWINDWPIYEPQFIDDHFWASHVGVPEGHVFREGECKEMGCLMTKPRAARKTPLSAEEQKEFAQLQIRDGRWWEYSLATLNPCWLINYMALCCVDDVSWGLYGLRIAHFNFWGFGHCSVELHMEAFVRPKTTSKWDLQWPSVFLAGPRWGIRLKSTKRNCAASLGTAAERHLFRRFPPNVELGIII
jgi:hypothetical protein